MIPANDILPRIEAYLKRRDMKAAEFGLAVGMGICGVYRLREGKSIRQATYRRITAWLGRRRG